MPVSRAEDQKFVGTRNIDEIRVGQLGQNAPLYQVGDLARCLGLSYTMMYSVSIVGNAACALYVPGATA